MKAEGIDAIEITPHDTNNLAWQTRGVYVGGTGNMKVKMGSGEDVTFTNLQGGTIYAFKVIRVFNTGTTCTGIIGLR